MSLHKMVTSSKVKHALDSLYAMLTVSAEDAAFFRSVSGFLGTMNDAVSGALASVRA